MIYKQNDILYRFHRFCIGHLKRLNQAKIINKSVILFWPLNMT